jgi:hypothetical protein
MDVEPLRAVSIRFNLVITRRFNGGPIVSTDLSKTRAVIRQDVPAST